MAILLSVSTVATSGTSSSMLVYASEADSTKVVAETQTEEPKEETEGSTTEVVPSEEGTDTTEGSEVVKEEGSEKAEETTTEEKKDDSKTEESETPSEEETKKEETEEPEVKTGEVKFQATSKGGKIKVTDKDLLNDNIAYVEGAEPFKAVLELGEVIHVEITADEGFEVATYKVTMDSGADAVNETEAEGTTYLTKDITVGEEGQLVSVEFKEIPKVEEDTENKDTDVDVSEDTTEDGTTVDDSQKVTDVVEEDTTEGDTEEKKDEDTNVEITEDTTDDGTTADDSQKVTEVVEDSTEGATEEKKEEGTENTQDSEESKKDESNVDSAESEDTLEEIEDTLGETEDELGEGKDDSRSEEGYPDFNSYSERTEYIWEKDTIDLNVVNYYDDVNVTALSEVPDSIKAGDSFAIEYEVSLQKDETYFWYLDVNYNVTNNKDDATLRSENFDKIFPIDIPTSDTDSGIPSMAGEVIEGKYYQAFLGDSTFDIEALSNGYDVSKFRMGIENDGAFDINKVGDYVVRYRVSYYMLPNQYWYVDSKISVVEEPKDISKILVESDSIYVSYKDDSSSTDLDFGVEYPTSKNTFILNVSPVNTNIFKEIKPVVKVSKDSKDIENVVSEVKNSDGTYSFTLSLDDLGYTIEVFDEGNETWYYPGKGYLGSWSQLGVGEADAANSLTSEEFEEYETIKAEEPDFKLASEDSIATVADTSTTKVVTVSGTIHDMWGRVNNYVGGMVSLNPNEAQKVMAAYNKLGHKVSKESDLVAWINTDVEVSCASAHYDRWDLNKAGWNPSDGKVWGFDVTFTFEYDSSSKKVNVYKEAVGNPGEQDNYQVFKGDDSFSDSSSPTTYSIEVNKRIPANSTWISNYSAVYLRCSFTLYKKNASGNWKKKKTIVLKASDDATSIKAKVTGLEKGDYKLVETDFSDGCANIPRTYEFTLNDENPKWTPREADEAGTKGDYILNFFIRRKGIVLYKYAEGTDGNVDKSKPLKGAVYKVEYSPNRDGSFSTIEGTWYLSTDENGGIEVTPSYQAKGYESLTSPFPNYSSKPKDNPLYALPIGWLRFTEVTPPSGYVLNATPITAEISDQGGTSVNATYNVPSVVNTEVTGTISLTKTSKATGTATATLGGNMAGAQYGVYASKANANVDNPRVTTLTIDASGKATATLTPGTYYFKEVKSPNIPNWVMDPVVHSFVIKSSKDTPVSVTEDEKPMLQIHKEVSANAFTNGYTNGYSIAGTQFTLYNQGGAAVTTFTIGYDGNSEVKYVDPGTYTLRETKTPTGFGTAPDKVVSPSTSDYNKKVVVNVVEDFLTGKLNVVKKSANTDVTDDNAMYSTKGAEYTVYMDSNCTQDVGKVIIGDNDTSNTLTLPLGTYYVKETKTVSNNSYYLNTTAVKTVVLSVKDKVETAKFEGPADGDKPKTGLLIGGVQKSTDYPTTRSLAGAEFTVKFYAGASSASGNPTRTWVFRSNEKGTVRFSDNSDFFVAEKSSPLYYEDNKVVIPLGYVTIQETLAPEGYTINPEIKGVPIIIDDNGNTPKFEGSVVANYNETPKWGGVKVGKIDHELKTGVAQGDATLEGAVFDIIVSANEKDTMFVKGHPKRGYSKGEVIYQITTDANGIAQCDAILQAGEYTIKETKPPKGYLLSDYSKTFKIQNDGEIVDLTGSDPVDQKVYYGALHLEKKDHDLNTNQAQGKATLEGAEFSIINKSKANVVVNNVTYTPNQVVMKITTNKEGKAATPKKSLPYGKYEVVESNAPTGYHLDTNTATVVIDADDKDALVEYTYDEAVIRGGFKIEKYDSENDKESIPQGDATLKGAEFAITSQNDQTVVVDGKTYNKGEVVKTIVTDEKGFASTEANTLPYGDYSYEETKSSKGYKVSGTGLTGTFSIIDDGKIIERTYAKDKSGTAEDVIRGGLSLQKFDKELNEAQAQGEATLENAEFSIINRSTNAVKVNGKMYDPGQTVMKIYTDKAGKASTGARDLPYGTYEIKETGNPTGYFVDPKTSTVEIREEGKVVSSQYIFVEQVVRGDFDIKKVDRDANIAEFAQGDATLKGAVFQITSLNEQPVMVDGVVYNKDEVVKTITTDEKGHAFTTGKTFPYGTYYYEEIESPRGYLLSGARLSGQFVIDIEGEIEKRSYESNNGPQDDVIRGGFALNKRDLDTGKNIPQGNATLENTKYEVVNRSAEAVYVDTNNDGVRERFETGDRITVLSTDADGYIRTAENFLPYGTYIVKEIEAPEGYLLDESDRVKSENTVKEFSIRTNGQYFDWTVNETPKNAVKRGGFQLNKVDAEIKGEGISQGDAVLSGAEFTLYNRSKHAVQVDANDDGEYETYAPDAVIKVLVTDEKGSIKTPTYWLPYGHYELTETKAPEGYKQEDGVLLTRTFDITKEGQYHDFTQTPTENFVYRGDIQIIKFKSNTSQDVDDSTFDDVIPLDGVKFHIELVDNDKLDENHKTVSLDIITDKDGVATTADGKYPRGRLPYGEYLVTETENPHEGFVNFKPFKIFVGKRNGEYVDGLTYKGIYKNNTPVETPVRVTKIDAESGLKVPLAGTEWQILDDKKNVITFDIRYPKPVKVTNFVLTEEDQGTITLPEKLPYGKYYLHEVHAPKGYLLMHDVEFYVTQWADWTFDAPLEVKGADEREKGKVVVTKYDKDTSEKLAGAVFEVYANDNITTGDGVTHFTKDDLVTTFTIGSNGIGESELLDLGKYYLKEKTAPEGYYLDGKKHEFELVYKDELTPIVEVNMDVTNTPTEFKLEKKDIDGLALEGIKFHIERLGDPAASGIDSKNAISGGDFTTDENGMLDVKYLRSGLYSITETETLPGYVLDSTPRYFVVTSTGSIYESKADGENITPNVEATNVCTMKWVNDYTKVQISKVDTKKNLIAGAKLDLVNAKGDVVYTWTSESDPWYEVKVPIGVYTLRETKAADGYTIASDITVNVENTGKVQKFSMMDKKMLAEKVDMNGDMTPVGATMEVREAIAEDGKVTYGDKVLDTWVTDGKAHAINNLEVLKSYVLIETKAPEGWVKANPVVFSVKDDFVDQTVQMVDIRMKANKFDQTKDTYVSGAKLEVRTTKGKVVDSWTTDGEYHYISGLTAGESYVLVETEAPKGYALAKPVNFTVNDVPEDQEVMMVNKKVLVMKVDTRIKELAGAELEVRDEFDRVVDKWTSDGTAHEVDGLEVGKTYTLVEVKAPEGYAIAVPITFTVADNAKNDKINLVNKKVLVHKSDITGEPELAGAKLTVLTLAGDVVDTWVSTEEQHAINNLVVGESYILREEIAPEGYVIASDVQFTVTDDKKDQTVTMLDKQVFVSKKSVTDTDELPGAKLTVTDKLSGKVVDKWTSTDKEHAVNGLKVNRWYILHEEVAPDGYVIASDVEFFVDDDFQVQYEEMLDKQVFMSKKEVTGDDELPGATIQVLDKKGNVVDTWVSTDKAHAIKNLKVKETYTLHEEIAPKGYVIASDVKFTVLDDFKVQAVEMIDKQLFVTKKTVTGEEELPGAELTVSEVKKNGELELKDSWVSGNEPHAVDNLKVGNTYVLTEETAPEGFVIAESITFTVLDDFQIQTVTMKDKIMTAHKVSETGSYVEGAKMEVRKAVKDADGNDTYEVMDSWVTDGTSHDINNLKVNETYTLVEVEAPKGWVLANPVEFTVKNDFQNQDVSMTDIRVKAHKFDETTEKYVEGADLEVYDDKGELVDAWTTGKDFHYINGLVAGHSYTMVETKAPKGFAIALPINFTVEDNGKDQEVVMINKKVITAKVDTSIVMLPGAELEVYDSKGNLVDSWTSDGSAHEIENLKIGETYTLVETKAPEGYAIATPITFTVEDNAKNDFFNMIDKQVFVSKKSVTGQDELPGAKLEVTDKETGKVVDKWTSGDEQHAINNLYVGKTYILTEKTAPEGYVIAESIEFTVADDAKNQLVEMKDKQLFVSKIDVTTEAELPGAHLKVTDENDKVMDEWVSSDAPHAVNNLEVNKTYTLTETIATKGYVIATPIKFTVLNDFKIQTVTMKDKQVFVSKKSVTGEDELPGAELTVTDVETEKVVDKWTSGDKEHAVENLVAGKEYILTEVTAPKGYVVATSIKFKVEDDFKVQNVEMLDKQVFVHKTDVTGEKEVVGAKLTVIDKETNKEVDSWTSEKESHAIDNLVVGKTYILREVTAPEGYAIATDVEFTVLDDFKIQTVTMVDKQVFVHKTDVTGEKEVEGAELTVIDKETKESVDSWTSGKEEHAINNLVVGKTYILREVTAPEGYAVATEIEFTVEDDGKNQTVTMVDQRVKVEKFDDKVKDYLPGAELEVRDEDDKVVDKWTTDENFHYVNNLYVGKTYTLVEVKAPTDYAIATPIKFTVEDDGKDMTIKMIDKQVINSKVDTTVTQLKGAELEVRDLNGKVIDKWTSDGTPHKIQNLVVGETYVLVETKAPEGYAIATPITFKVTDDATNQEFNLINKQVFAYKYDVDGKVLEGAKLSVVDLEGNVLDSWVSGKEPHAVSNIVVGSAYKLHEDVATDGYVIASDVQFFVEDDSKNQDIKMTDKQIFVSKVEIGQSEELECATLVVTDKVTGKELDKWVSGGTPHAVKGLEVNKTYLLTEVTAPAGYVRAEVVEFTVADDFQIQSVKMEDDYTKVDITKSDITDGTPVIGAELVIKDKDGNEVDRWVTEETPHHIDKLPIGDYTLTEITAPDGYVRAEVVNFTVKETGEIQKVDMKDDYTKVEITKSDITSGKPVKGATLVIKDKDGVEVDKWVTGKKPHYIEKLPVGDYTLEEITAPDGYVRAEAVKFTVKETGEIQKVDMKDDYTKVEISKKDMTTGKELPGAKLTIIDSKGKVVEECVSGDKPHYIEKLPVGKYTLREETAPDGYLKAEDVKFEVKETGEIQKVEMLDKPAPAPETPDKLVQTGEFSFGYVAVAVVVVLALVALFLTLKKRKNQNK